MGSEGDEMSRADFREEYREIAARTGAEICVFAEGVHPAILSCGERAAEVICRFFGMIKHRFADGGASNGSSFY